LSDESVAQRVRDDRKASAEAVIKKNQALQEKLQQG
jgi:hypothetical protein